MTSYLWIPCFATCSSDFRLNNTNKFPSCLFQVVAAGRANWLDRVVGDARISRPTSPILLQRCVAHILRQRSRRRRDVILRRPIHVPAGRVNRSYFSSTGKLLTRTTSEIDMTRSGRSVSGERTARPIRRGLPRLKDLRRRRRRRHGVGRTWSNVETAAGARVIKVIAQLSTRQDNSLVDVAPRRLRGADIKTTTEATNACGKWFRAWLSCENAPISCTRELRVGYRIHRTVVVLMMKFIRHAVSTIQYKAIQYNKT